MPEVYQLVKSWKGLRWHINAAPHWNGCDPWPEDGGLQKYKDARTTDGVSLICHNHPDVDEIGEVVEIAVEDLIPAMTDKVWKGAKWCGTCRVAALSPGIPWLAGKEIRTVTTGEAAQNRSKIRAQGNPHV